MQTSLNFQSSYSSNISVVNELQLSYRRNSQLDSTQHKNLNSSKNVAAFLRSIWNTDDLDVHESFFIICLSSKLDVIGYKKISDGGIDAVMVDMRLIFATALLCRSNSIILAHNHPSGSLSPSNADRSLTKRAIEAGEILSIAVNDHIILTSDSYYSFRDEGLM